MTHDPPLHAPNASKAPNRLLSLSAVFGVPCNVQRDKSKPRKHFIDFRYYIQLI